MDGRSQGCEETLGNQVNEEKGERNSSSSRIFFIWVQPDLHIFESRDPVCMLLKLKLPSTQLNRLALTGERKGSLMVDESQEGRMHMGCPSLMERRGVHFEQEKGRTELISAAYERRLFDSPVPKRHAYLYGVDGNGERTRHIFIGKEYDYARKIKSAVRATHDVGRSEERVFRLENSLCRTFRRVRATWQGEQLLRALQLPFEDILATLPQHHFNPFFDLLHRCREKHIADPTSLHHWKSLRNEEARMLCEALEALVCDLREGSKAPAVVRALDSARRRSDKRWKSTKNAIRESFQDCSKLLAIRLDLLFHMTTTLYPRAPAVSEEEAYGYMVKFERYLRDRYPLVRYIWGMEYGTETGFHFHILVFLNGHLAQDGIGLARRMGEHWEHVITEGKGRYFNCNDKGYWRSGLGMIHCADLAKCDALINDVAWYLTKTDIWMRYNASGRAFVISRRYKQPSPGAPSVRCGWRSEALPTKPTSRRRSQVRRAGGTSLPEGVACLGLLTVLTRLLTPRCCGRYPSAARPLVLVVIEHTAEQRLGGPVVSASATRSTRLRDQVQVFASARSQDV